MTDSKTQLFKNLQDFIGDSCGILVNEIAINAKLESDLRIYGDDAAELILAYSKKFNVDITNFNAENFIASEGDTILPFMIDVFKRSKTKRRDLTVLNLVNGVITGKLDEETIDLPE